MNILRKHQKRRENSNDHYPQVLYNILVSVFSYFMRFNNLHFTKGGISKKIRCKTMKKINEFEDFLKSLESVN